MIPNEKCADLHPILPHSDLGRWVAAHARFDFNLEQALADFGRELRMVEN